MKQDSVRLIEIFEKVRDKSVALSDALTGEEYEEHLREMTERVQAELASLSERTRRPKGIKPKADGKPWRQTPGIKILACSLCRLELLGPSCEYLRMESKRKLPPIAYMLDTGEGHLVPHCERCSRENGHERRITKKRRH